VFNPGETNKTITVGVIADTLEEANEHFFINLSNPTNISLVVAQTVGIILDDDTVPLSVSGVAVAEGHSGAVNADFRLSLARPYVDTVSVAFTTADGTAFAPGDYLATNDTLIFAPGETNKTITVRVNGDMLEESDETFLLRLSNPVHAILINTQAQATILNDDTPLDLVPRGSWASFPPDLALAVVVQNGYAFVAVGDAGLAIIDVSNPADPQRVGGYDTGGYAMGVAVSGNYAYVADGAAGLQVIDVSNPANPQLVGGYDTSGEAEDVAVSGSYAYVADRGAGLQVIDVSDPANPQRVGGDNTGYPAHSVAVSGNYAYVAESMCRFAFRCWGRLQVIDVSNPTNPQPVGGYDASDRAQGVAVLGNYAYVADDYAGLDVIDVSNPANPQRVGVYDTSGFALAVAVSGHYAYVADWAAGLQVLDVSNPTQPGRVAGNSAFTEAVAVTIAGTNVFVAAGAQGLMILDLFRAPLRLEPMSPQQPGLFRFLLHGEPGLSVRVQRSSNLRDWEDWQPVTLGVAPIELTDPGPGPVPHRFYRAVYP
jgi:hypothetical protein